MTDPIGQAALLPCPFCGAATNAETGVTRHAIDCWISLYYRDGQRGDHVVAAWNTRAAPQPSAISAQPRMGRCREHAKPGGCQLHNLHCGYPKCDEWPLAHMSGVNP